MYKTRIITDLRVVLWITYSYKCITFSTSKKKKKTSSSPFINCTTNGSPFSIPCNGQTTQVVILQQQGEKKRMFTFYSAEHKSYSHKDSFILLI